MGRGGYSPEEFQNRPPQGSRDTSPVDVDQEQERGDTVPFIPEGTLLFPTRTDGLVHSSKSGGSQPGIPQATPYERMGPVIRRILALENRITNLESSVPQSFSQVRWEFDDIWKEVNHLQTKSSSSSQRVSDTPPLFQGRGTGVDTSTASPTLSPPAFQQLMRQVIDELRQSGFVLRTDLDVIGVPGFQSDSSSEILEKVSALSQSVVRLEKDLTDPNGTIVKLEGRIKSLEDR